MTPLSRLRGFLLAALMLLPLGLPYVLSAQTTASPASSSSETEASHANPRPYMTYTEPNGKAIEVYHAPPGAAPATNPVALPPQPEAAPGLPLPDHGNFWALDTFQGKPDLVHLRYSYVTVNRHTGSNFFKAQIAPFIAKMKETIELQGPAAAVRLHTATPVFYVRGGFEDASDAGADSSDAPTSSQLALLRLKVKKHRRVSSTVDFTQITGTALRKQKTIPVRYEAVTGTGWRKITPAEPLKPGEYAIVPVFRGQDLFSPIAFDFAVDPKAPQNSEVILAKAVQAQGR